MANQIALGRNFYLFADDLFDSEIDHLLISAHGGYSNLQGPPGGPTIVVPEWTQLHFYAAHDTVLVDPGIYKLMRGDYQVMETVTPRMRVTNYELSKYQGKHNNAGETYASITNSINSNERQLSWINEQAALGKAATRNFGFRFHVLTVRNRQLFASTIRLSDAFSELDRAGRRYEHIHCSFCRGEIGGPEVESQAQAFGI